jgi:tRNA dimethylallyltransferase
VAHLRGEMGEAEALAEMISRTKAYAKRQLTWFRAVPGINWHDPGDLDGLTARARAFWSLEGFAS